MEQRQREMEDKAARLSGRLRGLYQAEQKLRDSRKVEVSVWGGGWDKFRGGEGLKDGSEKAASLLGRLRGLYQAEQTLRDSRKVAVSAGCDWGVSGKEKGWWGGVEKAARLSGRLRGLHQADQKVRDSQNVLVSVWGGLGEVQV